MVFLTNALMCIKKCKINNDCLPILLLLYIILHIMLVYSMLLAALSNAVCLHKALFFLLLIFANAFCFHALSWFIYTYLLVYYWFIYTSFQV